MEKEVADQLAVLGHPQRLAVFRMLMRRYPDRIPAGELCAALDAKPSTMSKYLSDLHQAGLIAQQRAGTSLLYSIDMQSAQDLLNTLFFDCCRGRPDLCTPLTSLLRQGHDTMTNRKFNVLFICVGNSARSIFAESLLRAAAGDRFNVYSAGTQPASGLNPFAVKLLNDKGHDTSALRAKTATEFAGPDAPVMDFVFTVCNQAANEECPTWPGQPISGHWGMQDPVRATGTDAEKSLAFQNAYGILKRRIDAFAALPFDSLDRAALQSSVDDIAKGSKVE